MRHVLWTAVAFTISFSSIAAHTQSAYAPQEPQSPAAAAPAPQQPPADATEKTPQQIAAARAQILIAEKRYDEAIKAYQELLVEQPGNARFANMLGVAYQQTGQLGKARSAYQRASRSDATFADPYNNIGTTWYQEKKYRKAVRAYLKALKVDPNLSSAYANLGFAYFSDKKYPEAIEAFNRALSLDPDALDAGGRGGSILQDHSVSDHGMFYFLLAKTFAERGDAAQCAQDLLKAVDEGYPDIAKVKTDPSFAKVIADPDVQAILQRATSETNRPAGAPGS
jgi:tetratricopeptide (TPR) repeat protein